ncbi:hypothetical protein RAS_02790 [Rickettsia asiatica]|uniref:Uncharacterized protein n=1 Tax=Rickettsia asiatica TaxID=238800 RepID=A0A510G6I4_9RICK|nr:hypothetical protein RAS_02790 [Rickettsia asiatica]
MIAKPISLEASIAASMGLCPISLYLKMFSSITIASSTTKTIASIIARSVNILIENPKAYITLTVPINDTGIVTNGIKVILAEARNK